MPLLRYLSLLDFDDAWLQGLAADVPGVDVRQVKAVDAGDVPDDVWAEVEVLHTTSVLPRPGQAPNLRLIQLDTSGCDHLRTEWVWTSTVPIASIGGVSPVPLAEYVMFMILGFAHRLPELRALWTDPQWPTPEQRWQRFGPRPLAGATVGILGYGRIGREVGRLARAHGMHVLATSRTAAPAADGGLYYDPTRPAGASAYAGVELSGPGGLRGVLERSDYVVVLLPLTDATRGTLDAAVLGWMKPGSVLVNVSRGGIVDEAALAESLREGRLAGAALDVFESEPLPASSPWWGMPGVVATPHVSGLAVDYGDHVRAIVGENLRRLLAGEPLLNQVDRERGY